MPFRAGFAVWWWGVLLFCWTEQSALPSPTHGTIDTNVQTFRVEGIIRELATNGSTLVIKHEAIPGYMKAMTMPFKVRVPAELKDLNPGDSINFSLHVTGEQSWIDQIAKVAPRANQPSHSTDEKEAPASENASSHHPLLDFKFTNELGQKVSLSEFKGQALAITFFFTRCPIPEYCPRLSRNFQEACRKLSSQVKGPTNWHFLSVTFDPQFDTAPVLKAYADTYHYDAEHWSFLTGPTEKITELARLSDVKFDAEGGLFNHNFRTIIIDAAGHLQMTFPIGGNLSDAIVEEILKAAAVSDTKPPEASASSPNADVR